MDNVSIRLAIKANFGAIRNLWLYYKESFLNVYLKVDDKEVIVFFITDEFTRNEYQRN